MMTIINRLWYQGKVRVSKLMELVVDAYSPGLCRHRQGKQKFKTSLDYITSSRPSWVITKKKKSYLRQQMGQQHMTQPVKVFGAQS